MLRILKLLITIIYFHLIDLHRLVAKGFFSFKKNFFGEGWPPLMFVTDSGI